MQRKPSSTCKWSSSPPAARSLRRLSALEVADHLFCARSGPPTPLSFIVNSEDQLGFGSLFACCRCSPYEVASLTAVGLGFSPSRITPSVRHRIFTSSQNER